MARPKKLFRESVGGYGHTVTVFERKAGGPLYLLWWNPSRKHGSRGGAGGHQTRSLHHTDREKALEEARKLSGDLLSVTEASSKGELTVLAALGKYHEDQGKYKKGAQPREDQRRAAMWCSFFGSFTNVESIVPSMLDKFCRERKAGRIKVPGYKLRPNPSDTAIGADIIFLHSVFNHCVRSRHLRDNPIRGYRAPKNKRPKRLVAEYERYLAIREHADTVDAQRMFGAFLDLVESLGWRVSAICQLRASDLDRSPVMVEKDGERVNVAPHGRIRKRGEVDKENVDMLVPLSGESRAALDRALSISRVIGNRYIFPAPKSRRGVKPWTRWHARDLHERAQRAAGYGFQCPKCSALLGDEQQKCPECGTVDEAPRDAAKNLIGFHAYRRAWATARKHLPLVDVAKAGGWKDDRSLREAYIHADAHTMLEVVSFTGKLREKKSAQ